MSNERTPTNSEPDAATSSETETAATVETEVKYRPAGWVVESTENDQIVDVSEPHAARALAEASARDIAE